jgi:histidine triad (HIT) family protein
MTECIFCKILRGTALASIVLHDERCCAFMDIHPLNPGHVVIVPTYHASSLADLDDISGAAMFQAALRIVRALRRSPIVSDGFNVFLADGAVAGQDVFHVHLHVRPRRVGDGFGSRYPADWSTRAWPSRTALDAVAQEIRQHL